MATLTFAYADSTAVVGPLALRDEPGSYDLCPTHADRLSVPRGWEVIRLPLERADSTLPSDLVALADAVREAAGVAAERPVPPAAPAPPEAGRRGHLTLVTDPDSSPGRR